MFYQTGFVRVSFGTVVTAMFISPVAVLDNQVFVQSIEGKRITLNNNSNKGESIILMIRDGVPAGDYLCEFRQV